MLQAMLSGVSGLQAHETRLNVIGNNIANVNTIGYKAERLTFKDQLSQTLAAASAPNGTNGGTNPDQVGLGVTVGAIDALETQGNLQSSGKPTDLAIQGSGFFIVAQNGQLLYTRDGTFDLDANGDLVNPATGAKLLGYTADANGAINTGQPVTAANTLNIPLGKLTSAKQTANVTFSGNLDAGAAIVSTKVDYSGNLDATPMPATTLPAAVTRTVYDAFGNPHTIETDFANPVDNPSGPGVPAGAVRSWDVVVKADGVVAYDSSSGKSKLYRTASGWTFADAAGNPLGASIQLNGGSAANEGSLVPGAQGANPFAVSLNYSSVQANAAPSAVDGSADGRAGSYPIRTTSVQVYDSLGIGHTVQFQYRRVPVQAGDPATATARWDWTATENGTVVGSSATPGNTPLYFDANGALTAGRYQSLTINPNSGAASPFSVKVDNIKVSQFASSSTMSADSQDGFAVGTLQSFNIAPDGTITGVFSNGQNRALGQIALASFANPAGLEKVGNNNYRASANSGLPQIGAPNEAGRGQVSPGFLEMSNVDLAQEFTSLIVTQRGFQANTRIVSVVDQLMQDVLNLKQ
ncbi:MAG: flagellar hook protein FlgE [Chthonomonadales bacterium]